MRMYDTLLGNIFLANYHSPRELIYGYSQRQSTDTNPSCTTLIFNV